MKTAKNLMTKDPITVPSGSELRDQVRSFIDNNISSAPVISPVGEILGTLTELALIRAYLTLQMHGPHNGSKVVHFKEFLEPSTTVKEDEPVTEVIKSLIKAPTHRLVVQNSASYVTGIISPKDILGFLAGEDHKNSLLRDELAETKKMLENIKEKLKDAEEVLQNYQKVYQDAPTMMHSVDAKGKIIMANKKIHEILGYKPGELLGKTLYDIYAKNCHAEDSYGLKRIIENDYHNSTYSTMMTKKQQKIRVDIASSALKDHHGKFIGTISVARVIDSDELLRTLHGVLNKDHVQKEDLEEFLKLEHEKV